MKKILSSVIATMAVLSVTIAAFPADTEKPIVPAGPIYATVPRSEVQNDADKATQTRKRANSKDAKARAKADAEDAKIEAGKEAENAKAKELADALNDASSAPR
jgi:hypothetical protein